MKLQTDFFNQETTKVARELIGATFVCGSKSVVITETEAYVGMDDPACHAAKGRTKRNAVMFDRSGLLYVYLIYGMHHCVNVVTQGAGFPAAVLLRGGLDLKAPAVRLDGPGKLCRYLQITRDHNYIDATSSERFAFFTREQAYPIESTPRIGIRQGTDKLWRFVIKKDALTALAR